MTISRSLALFAALLAVATPCFSQAKPVTDPVQPLHPHPRYTLHPGDIIDLTYRYTPDFNQLVTIQPDGYINANIVGSIHIGGLTLDQAHDVLVKQASTRLNDPELTILLKEFQQPYVVVAGEVQKPGKQPLREGTTALQAIMLSGGFLENARPSEVLLFRAIDTDTAEVKVLKLDHIRNRTDLEHDIALQPGDTLVVERDKIAKISRYIKLTNIGFYLNPLDKVP